MLFLASIEHEALGSIVAYFPLGAQLLLIICINGDPFSIGDLITVYD